MKEFCALEHQKEAYSLVHFTLEISILSCSATLVASLEFHRFLNFGLFEQLSESLAKETLQNYDWKGCRCSSNHHIDVRS